MKYHGVTINGASAGLTLCVSAVFAILFVTGCLLTPSMLEFRLQWDVIWRLAGDGRILAVAAHVLAGFAMLALLGVLWVLHMRSGWKMNRNRASGALFLAVWAVLTVTGVGILYFGGETASIGSSVVHTGLGLLVPAFLVVHVWRGLRSRRTTPLIRPTRLADRAPAE